MNFEQTVLNIVLTFLLLVNLALKYLLQTLYELCPLNTQ